MQARAIAAMPERELPDDPVGRARSGDFGAFAELYRRHVDRVYAICLRMTADRAAAEDSTQETFVRAWQKLDTLRGDGEFSAWLRRVAINVVLGDRRSRQRRQDRERPIGDPARFESRADPPARASAVDLERAIAHLPAGAREVFVLHDVEGYRHEEIAQMLSVATGTSKAQLHRARRLLRERLR